jgi:HK97 family phage major capsid protein
MDKVIELRNEIADKTAELRDRVEFVEKRDGVLTQEDRDAINSIENDIQSLEERLTIEEKLVQREANLAEVGVAKNNVETKSNGVDVEAEVRNWMADKNYVLPSEVRAIISADDGSTGIILPETFESQFWNLLKDVSPIRQYATVMTFAANKHAIPVYGTVTAAQRVLEGGDYPVDTDTVKSKVLNALKAGIIKKVPNELLTSGIAVEAEVLKRGAESFNALLGPEYITGTGTAEGEGITVGGTKALDATSATAVTIDELNQLFDSLSQVHQNRGIWLMKGSTKTAVRTLKNADNIYIYDPQSNTINGRPVVIDDNMPAMTTGNAAVVFGDLSQYVIGDRSGIMVNKLDQLYQGAGKVGFQFSMFSDSKVMDPTAIKYIAMA